MKRVPRLRSGEEAEAFLAQDLSDLDFAQFKTGRFEFASKSARVNFRLPELLLRSVKARATERAMPYQRFIREALEEALAKPAPKTRAKAAGIASPPARRARAK